jgi:hypothetical protein
MHAHSIHAENRKVVSAVWMAIGTLCSDNRERLFGLRVAETLVSSLRSHTQSQERNDPISAASVASSIAFAISRLAEPSKDTIGSLNSTGGNRIALFTAGCCEALTIALTNQSSDVSAATNIFGAIATLSDGQHCSQERNSFGFHGVCNAVAVAMRQHIYLEDPTRHACQAVTALCSCGDRRNQTLLRKAGVCELLAKALRASVVTVGHGPVLVETPPIVSEISVFSRFLDYTKGLGLGQKDIGQSTAQLSLTSTGPPRTRPPVPMSRGSIGDWKDKGRTALTALKALSYLSSGCDKYGGNSKTNFILGNEGCIEMVIEIWGSLPLYVDKTPSLYLSVSQWTSLSLSHLVDFEPSSSTGLIDSFLRDVDTDSSDDEDVGVNYGNTNVNLSRLCFCNKSGDLLVNSLLNYLHVGEQGKADAMAYNSLSVMVSMCEDSVGRHRVLSSDGLSKLLILLINRYTVNVSETIESQWLLLLSLSLLSSAALIPIVGDRLVQGGACRILASALVSHLLPSASKAIQQQSSRRQRLYNHVQNHHSETPPIYEDVDSDISEASDGSVTPPSSSGGIDCCPSPLSPCSSLSQVRLSLTNPSILPNSPRSQPSPHYKGTWLRNDTGRVMSGFEGASFTAPQTSREKKSTSSRKSSLCPSLSAMNSPSYSKNTSSYELRSTSAVRRIIRRATDFGNTSVSFDPQENAVLFLCLAGEAATAMTYLLTAATSAAVARVFEGIYIYVYICKCIHI